MASPIFTAEKLLAILSRLTARREIFVAYSGGVDSHVLLVSLLNAAASNSNLQVNPSLSITAVHINHGIHPDADQWEEHCRATCTTLQVPLIVEKINVTAHIRRHVAAKKKHQGMEAVARKLRYQALRAIVPCAAALLTAHHAADQAETLLLQLLRGAGPKGLAAIPERSWLRRDDGGGIELLRPLLSFSRAVLLQYANEQQLNWIEDRSNLDISINRNYLRQQVIPVLQQRWPALLQTCGRVAVNCHETQHLAEELAASDYALMKVDKGANTNNRTLAIAKLLDLDVLRQRNVLRYFLQQLYLPLPSRVKLEEIQRTVLHCTDDAVACVKWIEAEVRRYQGELYAMRPLPPHDASAIVVWNDLTKPLQLPREVLGGVVLRLPQELLQSQPQFQYTVRFRQGGERCRIKGRKHSSELKKLMQEWGIPPWQRDRIPLLYRGDTIVMVIGYCVCEGLEDSKNIS